MAPTAAELIDHAVAAGLVPGAVLAAGMRTADPALLHAAATEPLTHEARFDQTGFRTRLARYTAQRLTGASA